MDHDKILQIIPAPADMRAWYKDPDSGAVFSCPVVCLALLADRDGYRYVKPMDMTLGDGMIDITNEYGDVSYFSIGDERPEEADNE